MREISDNVADYAEPEIAFDDMAFGMQMRSKEQVAKKVISSYLTECWVVFKEKDVDTWPNSHKLVLWKIDDSYRLAALRDLTLCDTGGNIKWIDIADIMPEGM